MAYRSELDEFRLGAYSDLGVVTSLPLVSAYSDIGEVKYIPRLFFDDGCEFGHFVLNDDLCQDAFQFLKEPLSGERPARAGDEAEGKGK
jgi:hypothetical protein